MAHFTSSSISDLFHCAVLWFLTLKCLLTLGGFSHGGAWYGPRRFYTRSVVVPPGRSLSSAASRAYSFCRRVRFSCSQSNIFIGYFLHENLRWLVLPVPGCTPGAPSASQGPPVCAPGLHSAWCVRRQIICLSTMEMR